MNPHHSIDRAASQAINTRAAWRPILRPIGKLLIAAQLALVLQPLSALTRDKATAPFNPVADAQVQRIAQLNQTIEQAKATSAASNKSAADQASDKLKQAQELVAQLKRTSTPNKAQKQSDLKTLLTALRAAQADVRAEFAATKADLQAKKLPAEILQRHDEAVAQFEQRVTQFNQIVDGNDDDVRVQGLDGFFKQYPAKPRHTPIDPGKLPWGSPKATPRMPAETKTAWFQKLTGDQKVQLAQAGNLTTIGGVKFSFPPEPTQAPQDADLAETTDIAFTPAIKAKALELGNNPVNISNWVHNNIQWLPTWGSIQGADGTLKTLRGNAFDTASLTIALLRASGIPARYQFGTIDVPVEQAMNWVGGVQRPEAVLDLMYQGGIAARGINGGGRIATIRMEHVWVNAYVNWSPSRGNRQGGNSVTPPVLTTNGQAQHPNPNGALNAWVPIDGSFKQYVYTQGMNLQTAAPFDGNSLVAAAQQGATITPDYVQNLNQTNLQTQLTTYQSQLKTLINNAPPGTSSTAGDVIGTKVVQVKNLSLLAGVTPYPVAAQGNERTEIPASLRWSWRINLFADDNALANESPSLSIQLPTSQVRGKKLTLSFVPASVLDEQIIASYLPKPHADGSPIQTTELPSSLPGYLIRLKAEIRLDGEFVAAEYTTGSNPTGQSWQLGAELVSRAGLFNPAIGQWSDAEKNYPIVGETIATAFDLQGIGLDDLEHLKERLATTQAALLALQANPIGSVAGPVLNKEMVVGDMLYANALTYFATVQSAQTLAAHINNQVWTRLPSFGNFQTKAQPHYFFGIIRQVEFSGFAMDIDYMVVASTPKSWNDLADRDRQRVSFMRLIGEMGSAYEHVVPEQLLGKDPNNPDLPSQVNGYSAVKILTVAASQGQKIYIFTGQNQAAHQSMLGLINVDESVKDEITSGLASGFEVTIHEAPIAENGFVGSGYIIVDPSTGAGAWKVSGGANGVLLILKLIGTAAAISGLALSLPTLGLAALAGALGPWLILIGFLAGLFALIVQCVDDQKNFETLMLLRVFTVELILFPLAIAKLAGPAIDLLAATIARLTNWGTGSMATSSNICR